MVRSYFIFAIRNLFRHKMISVINIVGVSIAVAFVILAFLFIQHEWTYDRFHVNAHRIYRLGLQDRYEMNCNTPGLLGPAFARAFPDAKVARIYHSGGTMRYEARSFRVTLKYVDASFLDIFTFPLSKGDAATALRDLRSIVLTEETAQKLGLGDQPIGKAVTLNEKDYLVSGIASNMPNSSSIAFDGVLPFDAAGNPNLKLWHARDNTSTYVLLPDYADLGQISTRMQAVIAGRWEETTPKLFLQPLGDIHFNQQIRGIEPVGNPVYASVLLGIALIVVLIASVNFIALSIGRAAIRAKEVGIRKLVGASRWHVIFQHLGESILLAVLALWIGIGIAEVLLPSFNAFVGMHLSLLAHWTVCKGLGIVLLTLVVGLIAGLYPALVLSRYQAVEVLTARTKGLSPGVLLRVMGVFQFAMSMTLIMGTIAMVTQIEFLKNKHLGFDTENLVVIKGYSVDSNTLDLYKDSILSYPVVIGAAKTQQVLSNKSSRVTGWIQVEGKQMTNVEMTTVGYDYLKIVGLHLLEGRDFSKTIETDMGRSIIVNETFIKMLGWQTGVGKILSSLNSPGNAAKIIGVVEDFHFRSLHAEVAPMVLILQPHLCNMLLVRIAPDDIASTVAMLKQEWKKMAPDIPFRLAFLEDNIASQYAKDQRWFHIITFSAVLAVCLACLGAFGLTTLSVARKTHEIGIRKVMGASVPHLMVLLSRDFILLLLIANAMAWPVAYYFTSEWLRAFAYQIGLTTPLLAGGMLTLAVVLITVSIQTYRAVTIDPVQILRHK